MPRSNNKPLKIPIYKNLKETDFEESANITKNVLKNRGKGKAFWIKGL